MPKPVAYIPVADSTQHKLVAAAELHPPSGQQQGWQLLLEPQQQPPGSESVGFAAVAVERNSSRSPVEYTVALEPAAAAAAELFLHRSV